MRKDMQRVIITRRRGSFGKRRYRHARFAKVWRRTDPAHEPMSMGRGTKHFSDHLTPLWRFLAKRVGCRWNDVWSEICRHADRRSVVGRHLRDHVRGFVRTTPSEERWWWSRMYVDEAGILRWHPDRSPPWRRPPPPPIEHLVADGNEHVLARLAGIWYRFALAPRTETWVEQMPEGIALDDLERVVGRRVCVRPGTKRQLGSRQLRAHGLVNTPPPA